MGRLWVRRERRHDSLSAYIDNQLSARQRTRLEARLAVDPALRADLASLRRTVGLLRGLPSLSVPRDFGLPPQTRPYRRPWARPAWNAPARNTAATVVSLLFIVVLAGDWLGSGAGSWSARLAPWSVAGAATPVVLSSKGSPVERLEAEVQGAPAAPTRPAVREGGRSGDSRKVLEEPAPAPAGEDAHAPKRPPPRSLWRATEAILGLVALFLALSAPWAWRARRPSPWASRQSGATSPRTGKADRNGL